jgi:hypothetical protein
MFHDDIIVFLFNKQPVRLAGVKLLVLICFERKLLLTGSWWLVCSERKYLLVDG